MTFERRNGYELPRDNYMEQRRIKLEDDLRRANMHLLTVGHAATRANLAVDDALSRISEIEGKISRLSDRETSLNIR